MATSNFTRQSAASGILTNVMNAIGLTVPSTFVDSQDATVLQLVAQLTQCGKDLAAAHDWQVLHKEWELTTTTATEYPLPDDWNGFVDGAQWDNTNRWPMVGSVPPQIWRMLRARLSGGEWAAVTYKIEDDQLVLFNAPSDGTEYVLDYYSAGWLRDATDPAVYRDNVQNDSDVCLLDSRLLECLLELRWRGSKGFDTTEANNNFVTRWDLIVGRDSPKSTLSVAPIRTDGLLGYYNIPDTGYGG